MRKLKDEKGSITLFVLISMLFFVMFIVGMYALSANTESSSIAEAAKIKEIYEQGVNNIDDVYKTELEKSYKLLSKIAKPGDYIKYDTGVADIGENGVVTFRVLYNDETYGLQIISDVSISQVSLGGSDWNTARDSYNNAIETLNSEAMKYKGKLGLDARCVGSIPTVSLDGMFTSKNNEDVGPVILQFDSLIEGAHSMKSTDKNYIGDYTAMTSASICKTEGYYWVASRSVGLDSDGGFFAVCYTKDNGLIYGHNLCYVLSNDETHSDFPMYGLRPCISLRNGVKVIDGDGKSIDTAYILDI